MNHKSNYIFTNKNHPEKGIMSTVLGVISMTSIWIAIYLTFQNKGQAEFRYGSVIFLTMIFSFIGIGLGVSSRMEKDRFYFFSYTGIVFNMLSLAAISFILYAGAYGL